MERAGYEFLVAPSAAEEIHDGRMGMAPLCEENARRKAVAVAKEHPGALVLGADTLVFLAGKPLGKPGDMGEAARMLRELSGNTHQVCTGMCLAGPGEGEERVFHCVTNVHFRELDETTIAAYLERIDPIDKAGAYAIQDYGEMVVSRIEGPRDNVMGLPVAMVRRALQEIR